MPTIISGDTGIDKIAPGAIEYADLPTGSVLQVVHEVLSSSFSTSSGTWVDTGFSATITPKFSTSKILIIFNAGGTNRAGVASECIRLQIVKGSSTVVYGGGNQYYTTDAMSWSDWPLFMSCIDSPATTSATTYKIQMQTRLSNSCTINNSYGANQASIQLMEIAA